MTPHVNPSNARSGDYAQVIQKIGEDNICPFCPEHLGRIHPHPLDVRTHWMITDNAYPYKPKRHHKLLIHRVHISHLQELTPEAWIELHAIMKEMSETLGISGGSMLIRFGETRFTGASVTHLHVHLFQSDPHSPEYDKAKGVFTRVG